MHETSGDLKRLEKLIERSNASAGAFLRRLIEIWGMSLNARQLVRGLEGVVTVARHLEQIPE